MIVKYKDFVPSMISEPGIFREGEYEPLDIVVEAANQWVEENKIKLISIETVVLPNIWSRHEEGSEDVALGTSGDSPSRWHQFIRCWYRVDIANTD